jgi:hypothetical protein
VLTTFRMRLRERVEFMFVLWFYNVVYEGLNVLRVHKSAAIDRIINWSRRDTRVGNGPRI